jgi:acetoacetyl-CoA synthetase
VSIIPVIKMVNSTSCFQAFLRWISIHGPWRKSSEFNKFSGEEPSKEASLQDPEAVHPQLQSSNIGKPVRGIGTSYDNAEPLHPNSTGDGSGELLWMHATPSSTQMWDFMQYVNKKHQQHFKTYAALHRWSIESPVDSWGAIWEFCGVRHSHPYVKVIDPAATTMMWPRPSWFEGATLNFAENLLYPTRKVQENSLAVIAATETGRESVTWAELRERVRRCQASLKALDLRIGDRVAGCCANHINALVAMLATTSLGGIWTAVSPDSGVTAIVDRLSQIDPSVLFTDDAVSYNAKSHVVLPKIHEVSQSLTSLRALIVFRTLTTSSIDMPNSAMDYEDFLVLGESSHILSFTQLPAEQPVYILYSSGTTGAPKCIVHGAIGTLIQHKKEHILQSDIRPGDRL